MKRLKKYHLSKFAEWTNDDNIILQTLTDCMANHSQIYIDYLNSGERLITPYGWYTSKEGNVICMCYKDTGEIRSYRLDRILNIYIDENYINDFESQNDIYIIDDYNDFDDFIIPEIPNFDEIMQQTEQELLNEPPYDLNNFINNDFNNNDDNNINNEDFNEEDIKEEESDGVENE